MRVAPDHQREGIGQRLYDGLPRRARERGVRELVLDTMPSLTAAWLAVSPLARFVASLPSATRRFYEGTGSSTSGTSTSSGRGRS